MSCESTIRSKELRIKWKFTSRREAYQDSEVKRECLKERLLKIAEWEKGKKLDMPEGTEKEKSWPWLRKSDLKIPSEALICSAQEQAIWTNYVKHHIDKSVDSPSCRMCGETGETISHIMSECSKLAPGGYKRRHDNVTRMIHWKLCEKFNLEKSKNGIYTILKLLVKILTTS